MPVSLKDVMTKKLITIPMGTSTARAFELMKEKRIRHLPIVDELDDIVGIISKKDLFTATSEKIPVDFIMSSPVEYMDESVSVRSAILRLLEKKISCILVANEKGDASGILTTDDLLWYLASLMKDEKPLSSLLNIQTLGDVTNEISTMGI